VVGPGWLGLAQPMWGELGQPKKSKKHKSRKVEKIKNVYA